MLSRVEMELSPSPTHTHTHCCQCEAGLLMSQYSHSKQSKLFELDAMCWQLTGCQRVVHSAYTVKRQQGNQLTERWWGISNAVIWWFIWIAAAVWPFVKRKCCRNKTFEASAGSGSALSAALFYCSVIDLIISVQSAWTGVATFAWRTWNKILTLDVWITTTLMQTNYYASALSFKSPRLLNSEVVPETAVHNISTDSRTAVGPRTFCFQFFPIHTGLAHVVPQA